MPARLRARVTASCRAAPFTPRAVSDTFFSVIEKEMARGRAVAVDFAAVFADGGDDEAAHQAAVAENQRVRAAGVGHAAQILDGVRAAGDFRPQFGGDGDFVVVAAGVLHRRQAAADDVLRGVFPVLRAGDALKRNRGVDEDKLPQDAL